MSTNAACVFIELERNKWYYLLGQREPSAGDWRRDAAFHGPFSSDDMAQEHMRQNYPNPGAHEIMALGEGETSYDLAADPVLNERVLNMPQNLQAAGE